MQTEEPHKQPVSPPASPRGESQDGPPPNLPTSPPAPQTEQDVTPPPQQRPIRPQPQPYRPEQKRTYLNRGEVKTMEKDMASVRETEARREQQRIAELKALREAEREQAAVEKIRASAFAVKREEETQRKTELRSIRDSILPPGEERRIRDLPSPPSKNKKVFVRLLVVIFFAFIALNSVMFAFWFFFFRDGQTTFRLPEISLPEIPFISQFFGPPPPSPLPLPTPPPPPPEATPPLPPPPFLKSAIAPVHEITLQFQQASDLSASLLQTLQQEQRLGFTQLLFQRTETNARVENAEEFFRLFDVALPESVAPHFAGESLFFLYAYERGNRFGVIVQTSSPEEAQEALREWESRMEQDLAPVMSFWDQKTPAYTTQWRSSARHGIEIRFQTFSLQDYGIVHARVGNSIIFASSFEAAADAIAHLQSAPQSAGPSKALTLLQGTNTLKPPPSLSLEQKLGQTFLIGFSGTALTPELQDLMRRLQPGGVLLLARNIQGIEQLKQLTQDLQRISFEYSGLPLFIAVDQEGGVISRIDFGREKTPQFVLESEVAASEVGIARAEELKFLGINLNLSPVLDSTSRQDFLFSRTFQSGRLEAGQLAKALLEGQRQGGILSTAKHFPGYGSISFNPEKKLAVVQEFPDISPFVFALAAKPEFLLLSHVVYANLDPNQPFPFSAKGISLVRKNLNYQGIILTDDLAQPAFLNNYSIHEIATSPLKAGVTMLMFSEEAYATKAHEALLATLHQDPLFKKNVEDSATKIFELKKAFFFEDPLVPRDQLSQT